MAGEIIEHEGGREIVLPPSESANLLSSIVAAARDPAVDAGKMEAMANLALKLQAHEQEQEFNRDLNAALIAMPVITKAGRIVIPAKDGNPERVQGHFARFEDLNAVVKPILARNNLAITFDLGDEGGKPSCVPVLRHTNGWVWQGRALSAPIDSSGSKNNTQGVGSTASYLKRYTMCAALNIVVESEDDDGNGGQVLMPAERGNLIIEAAQAAFDDGTYLEWYRAQSPKDRGWLVTTGRHAEFGGSLAQLGGPSNPTPAKQPDPKPEPKRQPDGGAKPTPEEQREQWVASYVAKCAKVENLDALAEMQTAQKANLDRFREGYPDLWHRITVAQGEAYSRLTAAAEQGEAAPGEDLFAEGGEG